MFSSFFSLCIRLYWKYIPEEKRRICLYKESCSRHVYRAIQEKGSLGGVSAMLYRFKNCKKDYNIIFRDNLVYIQTVTGDLIDEQNMSPSILKTLQIIIKSKINLK